MGPFCAISGVSNDEVPKILRISEVEMKVIFLVLLLPFGFGCLPGCTTRGDRVGPTKASILAHADPCKETADKTVKVMVKPDSANSIDPIVKALEAYKPGFNLIIEVQSGAYRGENGILINQ